MEGHKLKAGLVYALLLFLGISLTGSYYLYYQFIHPVRFAPGVEIGGISIQGLNREQAAVEVRQGISAMYSVPVTFYKDDYEQAVRLGDLCTPLDAVGIVESVWKEESAKDWRKKMADLITPKKAIYPVLLSYDPAVQTQLIQEWDAKLGRPAQNAAIKVDSRRGLIEVPGQPGLKVDAEATFQALPSQMEPSPALRVPIIVVPQESPVTQDLLQNMGELSSFSTYFNTGDVNRSHNLALAASIINNSMVAPQAVFSLNKTVGERTAKNGFLEAKIIVGDHFEQGMGGGVCQVSSTLYDASLLAGLEIVERGNHNLAVAYIPLGLDATVDYGVQDFKFKNNTGYPVYIGAETSGGKITINIYGNLQYKQSIELSHIVDQTIDFNTVIESDPTLAAGTQKVEQNGQPGYVVRSFRTFYDKNGQIVRSELLATDIYQPLDKLILQGPEVMLPPNDTSA